MADPALDALARLTARRLRAPLALVCLGEGDHRRFAGAAGLPETWASTRAAPAALLLLRDARAALGLHDLPILRELGAAAYAGAPILGAAAQLLGALCAIDYVERAWSPAELQALRALAPVATQLLEYRRRPPIPLPSELTEARGAVLLVEDNSVVRHVLTRMLQRLGCAVYPAADGVEGLALALLDLPDVRMVLLDVGMPRMGGDEVAGALAILRPDLPVAVITGAAPLAGQPQLPPALVSLTKPVRLAELRALLACIGPASAAAE